jgi:P-type Cu+ transporter
MLVATEINEPITTSDKKVQTLCYHCGAPCITDSITTDDKVFCCEGCQLVYEVINENGLCDYYKLQSHPGLSQVKATRNDKYAYLDNQEIARQLYTFTDGDHTIATFYVPGVHCSSCMWLLEHLNRLGQGISESRLNFSEREITIHFSRKQTNIRKVVELLATIGYEPYISLDEAGKKKAKSYNKHRLYQLGVAGFCFGNIMMLSFPEYLSSATGIDAQYSNLFRYLNLVLSLPVFFYSASEFFITAWKGLKQRTLNIDAPIALAIIITFIRSIYEIASGTGAGYLDSMSGIVFFMLAGRLVQERTWKSLTFTRDYKSYFPIAVNVVTPQGIVSRKLQDLKEKDVVQLHHDEIVPADGIVLSGTARIDYSFVTGESEPIEVKQKEMVYAGGKQTGDLLTVQLIKPVAGSYLTSLWSHYSFSRDKSEKNEKESAVHLMSKYFTVVLFVLTAFTALYWYFHNPAIIISAVSAMLIIACPCALLLSATFTNGNIMRILSNNGLYLRDASVIEQMGKSDNIVFDKTGTITRGAAGNAVTTGHDFTTTEKTMLYNVVVRSNHPNSKALAKWLGIREQTAISAWKETPGKGIDAIVGNTRILVGSAEFAGIPREVAKKDKATTYVRINEKITSFHFQSIFRDNIPQMIPILAQSYTLSLLSGDNDKQINALRELFGSRSELRFEQKPIDKLTFIESLQSQGKHVVMIGDGLNDAGALQQSNVGITLADDINNFTPSCDAILDARQFATLPSLMKLARSSRSIIKLSFLISIIYNVFGLYFAMRGELKPVSAAILMPCSTLSIVLITSGVSSLQAWKAGLRLKSVE